MIININIDKLEEIVEDSIPLRLEAVGVFLKGEAQSRAPIDSSFLVGQIDYEVNAAGNLVRIIANTEYAAIQEFGGDIRPVDAGALTIPIHPDAKGKRAKDFKDLVLIQRKQGNPLLVRVVGKGKAQRMDIMFVLVQKATIPAQPYLGPALYDNLDKVVEIFAHNAA
ncbi:MAG: HK97 gp10 family phage protein [Ignavibacteriales bacterium]|nr:HK97 gp10 family phage protein [Ignavibacteriales bacterium]